MYWRLQSDVVFTFSKNVSQRRRNRDIGLHRKTQTMCLTMFVIRILSENDDRGVSWRKIRQGSKDLIISGGYNVYPKEIESVIDEMEGVPVNDTAADSAAANDAAVEYAVPQPSEVVPEALGLMCVWD